VPKQNAGFGPDCTAAEWNSVVPVSLEFRLADYDDAAGHHTALAVDAQRRRNTWVGIIIHRALNAAGFIVVASGLGS